MALPWIKLDVVVPAHPKMQRLEKRLDVADGLGIAVRLWCWTAAYFPAGEIPAHAADSMARAAIGHVGKIGDPGVTDVTLDPRDVTDALCEVGLLEAHGDRYVIHDWALHQQAHADKAERDRANNAERQRRFRNRAKLMGVTVGNGVTSRVTVTESNGGEKSREEKKKETSAEPQAASAPADDEKPSPVVARLPCVGKGLPEYRVTEAQVTEWGTAFPGVDVPEQIRRMGVWLQANRAKRKTHKGTPRFIVSWLGRQQDQHPKQQGKTNGHRNDPALVAALAEAERETGGEPRARGGRAGDGAVGDRAGGPPSDPLAPDGTDLLAEVGAVLGRGGKSRELQDAGHVESRARHGGAPASGALRVPGAEHGPARGAGGDPVQPRSVEAARGRDDG